MNFIRFFFKNLLYVVTLLNYLKTQKNYIHAQGGIMKKLTLQMVCFIFLSISGSVFAVDTGQQNGQDKITICHKGETLHVADPSILKAHLAHGDTLGKCAVPEKENQTPEKTTHDYLYYPASSVYFDDTAKVWHFFVGNKWVTDKVLPSIFKINDNEAVKLVFDTDQPYLHHEEVLKKYPVPSSVAIPNPDAAPAPVPEIIKHHYKYYPDLSVYFDEGSKLWHYLKDGKWITAEALPPTLKIGGDIVDLVFDTDKPYLHHDVVVKKYPAIHYQYKFYPGSQVYFDDIHHVYHYFHAGKWITDITLPDFIKIIDKDFKLIELKTSKPYLHHHEIEKKYGSAKDAAKVTICHKRKNTLTISEAAVDAHLAHGDKLGACSKKSSNKQKHKGSKGYKKGSKGHRKGSKKHKKESKKGKNKK